MARFYFQRDASKRKAQIYSPGENTVIYNNYYVILHYIMLKALSYLKLYLEPYKKYLIKLQIPENIMEKKALSYLELYLEAYKIFSSSITDFR